MMGEVAQDADFWGFKIRSPAAGRGEECQDHREEVVHHLWTDDEGSGVPMRNDRLGPVSKG